MWAYTAIVTTLAVVRYGMFVSHGYSLAGYLTAFALILHGNSALLASNLLTQHIALQHAWALWVLAPFAKYFDLSFLFFASAFWVGTGSLAIWRIGLMLGRDRGTIMVASVLYLLYPSMIAANIYDFHLMVWASPIIVWLVWYALDRRWVPFLALLVLATGIGVGVSGALLLTGLGLILWRRTVWFGLLVGAFTVLYWGISHGLSWPLQEGLRQGHIDLRTVLYLAWIVLPAAIAVGGLMLRKGLYNVWWVPVVALVGFNVMQGTVQSTSPFTDASAWIAPFLALIVVSAGHFPSRLKKLALLWTAGWVVLMGGYLYHATWRPRPTNVAELHTALAMVPQHATLVGQSYILPHRRVNPNNMPAFALGRIVIPAGTYVLIDPSVWDGYTPRTLLTEWQTRAARARGIHLLYHHSGVWLFRTTQPIVPIHQG